jgi:aspartyl-tRNA synthetase
LFVDLRDRYGLTQVVFNPPDTPPPIIDESKSLRAEYVIQVTGRVAERPAGMANAKLATGEIELRVTAFKLLNKREPHAAVLA